MPGVKTRARAMMADPMGSEQTIGLLQWLINGLLFVASALFGWIANDMKRRLELLEASNREGGQHVAVLQSQMASVLSSLGEMNGKLDRLLERRSHPRE